MIPTIIKSRESEFEVQAEAYFQLRNHFPIVRGEVPIVVKRRSKGKFKRGARFDLVILESNGQWICTIEVKDNPSVICHAKQKHYEELTGVPNILICGIEQARNAISIIENTLTAISAG